MRRTSGALLAAALALLAAAAAYLAAFGAEKLRPGPAVALARTFSWQQTVSLTGAVIREEAPLLPGREQVRLTAREGQRLSAGETAGVTYDNAAEYMRAALLVRLRRELAEAASAPSVPGEDAMLRRTGDTLSSALVRGDFDGASAASHALSLGLFPGVHRDTAALREEIAALEAAGAAENLLCGERSGFFSAHADGWESLSPTAVRELTCADLEAVIRAPELPTPAAGRLITGSSWLLAVLTNGAAAALFAPGDTVPLEFDGRTVRGEAIWLRAEADGQAMVVFRCRTDLEAVLARRVLTVRAVTDQAEGLLIPAEALHREGDTCYLFRRSGEFFLREEAELIRRLPQGALVSCPGLRDGAEVLLGDPEEDTYTILR